MKNFKILVWVLMLMSAGADVYAAGEVAATRQVTEVPGVMKRSIPMTRQQAARQEAARQALIKGGDQLAEVGSPRSITESSPVQIPGRMQVVARQKIEQNTLDGLVLDENEANNSLQSHDDKVGSFVFGDKAIQDSVDVQVQQKVDEIVNSVSQAKLENAENNPQAKEQLADQVVDQLAGKSGLSPEETSEIKTEAHQDIKTVKLDEPGAFSKFVNNVLRFIKLRLNGYKSQDELNADLLDRASKSLDISKQIKLGADPKTQDKYGGTALHLAARKGDAKSVQVLLDAGADKDVQTKNGYTPLHFAALNGGAASVQALLDAGAEPKTQDKYGQTALHLAAYKGDAKSVQVLVDAGADKDVQNKHGLTALDAFKQYNKYDVSNMNHVTTAIALGSKLDETNENGTTALHVAVIKGDAASVKLLLAKGADLKAQDTSGRTALHYAVGKGDAASVKLLFAAGADLNVQDKDGFTPLHAAVSKKDAASVKLLVSAGAELNTQEADGYTPLHQAVVMGDPASVKLLLDAGADNKMQNNQGESPLHSAAQLGDVDLVTALINKGADPKAQDKEGFTAFHLAKNPNTTAALNRPINQTVSQVSSQV